MEPLFGDIFILGISIGRGLGALKGLHSYNKEPLRKKRGVPLSKPARPAEGVRPTSSKLPGRSSRKKKCTHKHTARSMCFIRVGGCWFFAPRGEGEVRGVAAAFFFFFFFFSRKRLHQYYEYEQQCSLCPFAGWASG